MRQQESQQHRRDVDLWLRTDVPTPSTASRIKHLMLLLLMMMTMRMVMLLIYFVHLAAQSTHELLLAESSNGRGQVSVRV